MEVPNDRIEWKKMKRPTQEPIKKNWKTWFASKTPIVETEDETLPPIVKKKTETDKQTDKEKTKTMKDRETDRQRLLDTDDGWGDEILF